MEQYRGQRALLTDLYQFTMAYGYWLSGRHGERAEFELFFREAPFQGGFALFFGLSDCVTYLQDFSFSPSDITYLQSIMADNVDKKFYEYLQTVDASEVTLSSFQEGSVVFAREPLIKVTGPLLVVQLLETTLLALVNYASLVGTNAARFRLAAGPHKKLVEMGLRRAQGPDGGFSASKYSYLGGFDATSNVLAGKLCGIPVSGTVAHSYVSSFTSPDEVHCRTLQPANGHEAEVDILLLALTWLEKVCDRLRVKKEDTNPGELAAFVSYAVAFPHNFLVVVDTYNVMMSGIPNFCAVALALSELGYQVKGVRLDSGNLAQQSVEIRKIFLDCATYFNFPSFKNLFIAVSNNISEKNLKQLAQEKNEINMIGIGTHLVTCTRQPSLGCVYKLVQVNENPCMKLSEDLEKMTIPGSKDVYRLYDSTGYPFLDLLALEGEPQTTLDQEVEFHQVGTVTETVRVTPIRAERQHIVYFKNGQRLNHESIASIELIRTHAQESLNKFSQGHLNLDDPQPYKVAVTEKLHGLLTSLRRANSLQ